MWVTWTNAEGNVESWDFDYCARLVATRKKVEAFDSNRRPISISTPFATCDVAETVRRAILDNSTNDTVSEIDIDEFLVGIES